MKLRFHVQSLASTAALVLTMICIWMAAPAQAQEEWIDAHVHLVADKGALDDFDEVARNALQIMDSNGIKKMVIMSPPRPNENYDIESLKGVMAKYGTRFAVMAGGGSLNPMLQEAGKSPTVPEDLRQRFEEMAEGYLDAGAIGFGEIAGTHLSLYPSHGYESVPADHPLLLLLADIAARHGVPIDLHFDPIPEDVSTPSQLTSPRNPPMLKANLAGLERLLDHNPNTIIMWAHAGSDPVGFFTPELVRDMLSRHPNLNFSIRPLHNSPDALVNPRGGINGKWVAVFRDFPDRFVIGTDSFIVASNYSGPDAPKTFAMAAGKQRNAVQTFLNSLPDDLARRIGFENAERIYKLNQ
jgi:hypothetical protein